MHSTPTLPPSVSHYATFNIAGDIVFTGLVLPVLGPYAVLRHHHYQVRVAGDGCSVVLAP